MTGYAHYLSEVASLIKMRKDNLRASFNRFLLVMPEAEDHVEVIEEKTRGGSGGRCLTYRMDSIALAAFLYWHEHRGRLPRFFGVERRIVEPDAVGSCPAEKRKENPDADR